MLWRYMHQERQSQKQLNCLNNFKDRVIIIILLLDYVTIEKINTFTQKFDDDRSKVKIVVTLKVTTDGKKRVNEEIK